MKVIEKIMDKMLSKHWLIALLSFVISVMIWILASIELFDKLPFGKTINTLIGLAVLYLCVYLLLYFIIWLIQNIGNAREIKAHQKEERKKKIEEWRYFFDSIPTQEYSIIMSLIEGENKTPYEAWGIHMSFDHDSIFGFNEKMIFNVITECDTQSVVICSFNGIGENALRPCGKKRLYYLKDDIYKLFKEIIKTEGTLSHHHRETYPIKSEI